MTYARRILGAVLAGIAVAGILWAVGGAPGAADVGSMADGGPDSTDVRAASTGGEAPAFRARAGTTRTVRRARDVAGGPDWVVQRFVLERGPSAPFARRRPGPVRCVRLGRLVDGRVTWIDAPGRRGIVPPERQPTLCTLDAQGRDLQTLAVLQARGGRVRRTALVTFGFGRGTRGGRRVVVHGRTLTPPGGGGFLRVDRPIVGETPVNARAPLPVRTAGPGRGSGLPATVRRRMAESARREARNVTSEVRHPRVVSQSGTAAGTVGVVVGRMPRTGEPCVAVGVTPAFLGTVGRLRGTLGVVEVGQVHSCRRLADLRRPARNLPLAATSFLRRPDGAGHQVTYATATVITPPGVDRVELRTVAGVQTVRVAAPGVALALWPQSGAGQDAFGPAVTVVGMRADGRRIVPRGGWVEPQPPTGDVAFGG